CMSTGGPCCGIGTARSGGITRTAPGTEQAQRLMRQRSNQDLTYWRSQPSADYHSGSLGSPHRLCTDVPDPVGIDVDARAHSAGDGDRLQILPLRRRGLGPDDLVYDREVVLEQALLFEGPL